jgi:hypothetical protein
VGAVGALVNQLHDYEPGIQSNGVFWTVAVPPSSVTADSDAGTASSRLSDYAIPDYVSALNSLAEGPHVPAAVSFDLQWAPGPSPQRFEPVDDLNGFRGEFTEGVSTIEWSSQQDGFKFQSDPASTATSLFAVVGHERNGAFFADPANTGGGAGSSSSSTNAGDSELPPTGGGRGLLVPAALAALALIVRRRSAVAGAGAISSNQTEG